MSNDLFASFRHVLELDHPAVQKMLGFLQNHQGPPSNRELKVQLQYTRHWCVLAKLLYENRHLNFKVPKDKPLNFTVVFDQSYSTDCYWYYVFYQVWALTEMLFAELLHKLELRKLVMSDGPARFPLPESKVSSYTLYALEVIAMQRFCLDALQTHAKSFDSLLPAFKQVLTLKQQWLVMTNLWLTANNERRQTDDDRKWVLDLFQACYLLVSRSSDFQSDELIQAMARNARIQSFLAGADYYWAAHSDRSATGWCYDQAKKEGWRPKPMELQKEVDKLLAECTANKIELKQPQFIVITDNASVTEAADLVKPGYLRGLSLHLDEHIGNSQTMLRSCVSVKTVKLQEEESKQK